MNKEAKASPDDVLLLIQRALVLLGSALHSISIERHKILWAKTNPNLRSVGSKEYRKGGFLEKASNRLEVKKTQYKNRRPPSVGFEEEEDTITVRESPA